MMKAQDYRINTDILKELIGESFVKYKCDPFIFTNSVYMIVGLFFGNKTFKLTNSVESVEYYGDIEDVAILRLEECEESDIKSGLSDTIQIETPVNEIINKIIVIEENQKLYKDSIQTHDVWHTRAIIFYTNSREYCFIKDEFDLSEEIEILRGYDLSEKINVRNKSFDSDWSDGFTPDSVRIVIELS